MGVIMNKIFIVWQSTTDGDDIGDGIGYTTHYPGITTCKTETCDNLDEAHRMLKILKDKPNFRFEIFKGICINYDV